MQIQNLDELAFDLIKKIKDYRPLSSKDMLEAFEKRKLVHDTWQTYKSAGGKEDSLISFFLNYKKYF